MKRHGFLILAAVLLTGCFGGRYISADGDLEALYVGKTYYEIVDNSADLTPLSTTEGKAPR